MPRIKLSFISGANERVAALLDGTVEPEGAQLLVTHSAATSTGNIPGSRSISTRRLPRRRRSRRKNFPRAFPPA
jgi:hypothetical protein